MQDLYLISRPWQMHTVFSNHTELTGHISPLSTKAPVLLFIYLFIYLFMGYFTALPVSHTMLHRTVGQSIKDKLERNWKHQMSNKSTNLTYSWRDRGKQKETLVRLIDVPPKIWTKHILCASLRYYWHTSLLIWTKTYLLHKNYNIHNQCKIMLAHLQQ